MKNKILYIGGAVAVVAIIIVAAMTSSGGLFKGAIQLSTGDITISKCYAQLPNGRGALTEVPIGTIVKWMADAVSPDGTIIKWEGVGTGGGTDVTTTEKYPQRAYSTVGTIVPKLTISNRLKTVGPIACQQLIVYEPLTISTCNPSPSTVNPGTTVTWGPNVYGGQPSKSITYAWQDVAAAWSSTTKNPSIAYNVPGDFAPTLTVTRGSETVSKVCPNSVYVNQESLSGSCVGSAITIGTNTDFTWTVSAKGGTLPYNYVWKLNNSNEFLETPNATYPISFTQAGKYSAYVIIQSVLSGRTSFLTVQCPGVTVN